METATRKLQFETGSKKLERIHVLDQPRKILRHPQALDKTQTPVAEHAPASLGDYVFASKGFTLTGKDPRDNSRILRLASIARYRRKRRMITAEKAIGIS
jgi:hypothetical protein